ncbi:MAG: hypothetical protein ABSD86_24260, partial [Candidatus Sulfotelmatobacter sp.]
VNVLLLAFTPMIVRRGSSSFKRRYACTHTRGSVRRVSGFVLTGKQEVIRPGRKLVLPFYERWMGIIGKIRVSPPQNLLMNGEVNQPSWLRIQSVNRVFGLTLTINLIDCPGDAIRIQTGCRWSSNMTSKVILMLSELRSKDQKPPRCVVRAWAG